MTQPAAPTWCSLDDVRNALASPDAVAQSAASMPEAILVDQVREAEGTVRMYLAAYTVPLDADGRAPWPVRAWVRNIAAYLAHLVWSRSKDVPVDEPNRLRYAETMRLLTLLLTGALTLEFEPSDNPDAEGSVAYNLYTGRLFAPEDFIRQAEFGQRSLNRVGYGG